jgi:hypothetical protein
MSFATRNGLPWVPDDVSRLRELAAAGRTPAEMAQALNRTKVGVKSKAASLGIVFKQARVMSSTDHRT